jgi:hypothetical protein
MLAGRVTGSIVSPAVEGPTGSIGDLVRAGIDHLLASPEEEFEKAADYVLKKNEELYRRLA